MVDRQKLIYAKLRCSQARAVEIETLTRGQSNNDLWRKHRMPRITASVVKMYACRRKEFTNKFLSQNHGGHDSKSGICSRTKIVGLEHAFNCAANVS